MGLSSPSGVQPQPLKLTGERYGLVAVGPSRRSQSCASRAKSRAKFPKCRKGFSPRRGPERLTSVRRSAPKKHRCTGLSAFLSLVRRNDSNVPGLGELCRSTAGRPGSNATGRAWCRPCHAHRRGVGRSTKRHLSGKRQHLHARHRSFASFPTDRTWSWSQPSMGLRRPAASITRCASAPPSARGPILGRRGLCPPACPASTAASPPARDSPGSGLFGVAYLDHAGWPEGRDPQYRPPRDRRR